MRHFFAVASFIFAANLGFGQNSDFKWSASLNSNRSFIENQGQFDQFMTSGGSEILYAVDAGPSMILFQEDGFTFQFTRKVKNPNRKRGERNKPRYLQEMEAVRVTWTNANSRVKVRAEQKSSHRSTYAMLETDGPISNVENVSGYQKLVYENLYPNVDVIFSIHEIEGIKYDLVLHPGADASSIRMMYPKEYQPELDSEGNLIIHTGFGDILDHAPSTFYADTQQKIGSNFKIDGSAVGFELEAYDTDQKVIIDPWVVTPAFPNSNGIWDIDVDDLGNVYVYGGDTPMRLQKYDAAGALQWTYNTPWDTANYWVGTMITEPTTGDCFITAGTDPRIQRISTSGSMLWNANGGAFDEYWKFSFNCDFTRLMLGGTRLTIGAGGGLIEGYGYVFEIDMSNGSQINDAEIASVSPGPLGLVSNPNEVRAMCPSPNGKFYYLTLDTIGVFDDNLTLGYQDNHGYGFSYRVAGYGVTNQSINAMAATTDFIYTLDGSTLDKRNIVDGSIVLSAPIPNGTTSSELGFNSAENGGLELDSCGNVYVGSGTGVYKFDENLNQLGFQSTPGRVYDVAVNNAGEVVACGQGFVASLNLTPCARPKAICLNCLELTPAGPYCQTDGVDTLMADPGNGVWSGPGIIDPVLGIFDPAVADTGSHVIHFAPEIPLVCGIDSMVIRVNFCTELLACFNGAGDITVSNGVGPYTWSETIDTVDCSTCFPGIPPFIEPCSTPPGCAVPTTFVSEFAVDTTVTPTGNWPLIVEDSQGNILTINSISELPPCESGCFITVNLPDTVVACTGDSAFATAVVTGAIGNVVYSWNTVPTQSTQTAVGLAPGSYYMVTVTDDSLCTAIDSVYVVEEECLGPIVCVNPFGDMVADGVGPFTWYEYVDSLDCSDCIEFPGFPPCSFPPGCGVTIQTWEQFAIGETVTPTGNWPVAVVDGVGDTLMINSLSELVACTQTCYITVDVPEQSYVCFGQSDGEVTAVVNGAFGTVDYSWNTSPIQTTETATDLGVGTYAVTVMDENNCEATDTVEVLMLPELLLQISGTDSLCQGLTTGSATVVATGGAGSYQYSWDSNPVQNTATASNLGFGTYTVTVSDLTGCSEQISHTIHQQAPIVVDFDPTDDVCPGSTDGTATVFVSNGSGNYTYQWNTNPVQNGATASGLVPGTYVATATAADGCQGTGSVTIGQLEVDSVFAGNDVTICEGEQTLLQAEGAESYYWFVDNGVEASSVTVSPDQTTTYSVSGTDSNDCTTTDQVTVSVVSVPYIQMSEVDSALCDVSAPIQLTAFPPGGEFAGNGVSSSGLFDPGLAGNGFHTITYSYEVMEGCIAHAAVSILVDENLCDIIVPNVFNPSTDYQGQTDFCGNVPQNNVFNLPCLEWYPGNRVRIFDRWGRKHYDQTDYHLKPWDGGNQSDGVYYYIVEMAGEKPVKGFFHLIR
jgi:hypothetical protein